MKLLAVVVLVLALVMVGLPFTMGMDGMSYCPKCAEGSSSMLVSMCLAVIASVMLAFQLAALGFAIAGVSVATPRGRPSLILRPPR